MFLHVFQLETFEYRIIHHISFDYFHFILNLYFSHIHRINKIEFFHNPNLIFNFKLYLKLVMITPNIKIKNLKNIRKFFFIK